MQVLDSPIPRLSLLQRIEAEKGRRDLKEFVKQAWHVIEPTTPFISGWHIDAIIEHLSAVSSGEIRNLLINIPPRHAKSLIVSVFWPMWTWIDQPHKRWLCSSYALSLAIRDNRKCKILIESDWFRSRYGDSFTLSSDQKAKGRFENSSRGYRMATSVGSAATGEGGDIILCFKGDTNIVTSNGNIHIDDIVNNRMPVHILSYNHKQNMHEWKTIEAYEKNPGKQLYRVSFSNQQYIEATEEHPVYVIGKGYIPISQLKINDEVVTESVVETILVRCVEPVSTPEYVYNLRIADNHNYYASGKDGLPSILVHNCDDPHNVLEAYSDVKREEAIQWWDTTMSSRLNDPKKGSKIVVMQRIHMRDLSGHLLEQGDCTHLCLPAEFESSRKCFTSIGWEDPRTEDGQLLWPDQIGTKELDKLKVALGSAAYAAQYQQSPSPLGGNIFKHDHFVYFSVYENHFTLHTRYGEKNVARAKCWLFATVDLAASLKTTADYTVISTWAVTPDNELLLLEQLRDRMTGPDIQRKIALCYQRFRHNFVEIEQNAFQLTLVQEMIVRWGVPVRGFTSHKDKVSRAISASVFYEAGQVYHLQFAEYLTELEKELLNFPKAEHDDTVDTVSRATEVCFNPNQPNMRLFDDDDTPEEMTTILRPFHKENKEEQNGGPMERDIFGDW